ncbi:MAG: hypothetical protein QOJ65_1077 [Fimbriimonadaceae bacterium]|nr:hypothetical protein [Fimbriimonadaceae bacterium]
MSTDEVMPGADEAPAQPPADADDQQPHPDHPHAGVAAEGWSTPQTGGPGEPSCCGEIVLKRGGAETDIKFSVNPPAVIGRFDPAVGPIDVDLAPIPEGTYVSRKHAKITCDDGVWTLSDMGSSNGTFILRNDFERVDETELKDGDEFALGNARFAFHVIDVCEIANA